MRRGAPQENVMKITVIKKSNGKVQTLSVCPWIVDALEQAKK